MPSKKIIKYAFLQAGGTAVYIALIAMFMTNAEKIFGKVNNPLGVMVFLLTFVISAAMMGILIFGRPVIWYLNNSKKEAIALLFYTVTFLILIALFVFLIIAISQSPVLIKI